MSLSYIIFVAILIAVNGQRSPYAGSRPGAGYKDRYVPQASQPANTNNGDGSVVDRLGENGSTQSGASAVDSTTQRLPYDAYGDKFIVDHYNSLPVDQRPFWILNQQQIEAHRGTPPRGTQLRPQSSNANTQTGTNVVDRFAETNNNNINGQRPLSLDPLQYNPNAVSQQEIVYPANLTPEQRLEMEINYQRDRLAALERQRQQLQGGNQQNPTSQQQSQLGQQNPLAQQNPLGQQNNQQLPQQQQQQQQQQLQTVQRVQRGFVPPQNGFPLEGGFRRPNAASQFVAPYFSEYDFYVF